MIGDILDANLLAVGLVVAGIAGLTMVARQVAAPAIQRARRRAWKLARRAAR